MYTLSHGIFHISPCIVPLESRICPRLNISADLGRDDMESSTDTWLKGTIRRADVKNSMR